MRRPSGKIAGLRAITLVEIRDETEGNLVACPSRPHQQIGGGSLMAVTHAELPRFTERTKEVACFVRHRGV